MARAFAKSVSLPVRAEPRPKHAAPEPTPYRPEWDERLYTTGVVFAQIWMTKGFISAVSMLTAKVVFGCWRTGWRAWSMFRTIVGGRVTDDAYVARMVACGQCHDRVDVGEKKYCGPCRCPHWILSRLDKKNRYKRWRCPEGRHVGSVKRKCAGCG